MSLPSSVSNAMAISDIIDQLKDAVLDDSKRIFSVKLPPFGAFIPVIDIEVNDFNINFKFSIPDLLIIPFDCSFCIKSVSRVLVSEVSPPLSFGSFDSNIISSGSINGLDAMWIRTSVGLFSIELLQQIEIEKVGDLMIHNIEKQQ